MTGISFSGGGPVALAVIVAIVLALTGIQVRSDASVFDPYFGGLPPLIVMAVVSALAFVCLGYLDANSTFATFSPVATRQGLLLAIAVTPVLAAAAVGADVILRFPEDINVGIPDAFAFYPVIGFFVEACLHAVPLTVLVAVFGRSGDGVDARFWLLVIPIVLLEAGFQAAVAGRLGLAVFSGIHLLVFGALELYVWQRYGFVSMYAFRLAYYLLWHIAWGWMRLRWLF